MTKPAIEKRAALMGLMRLLAEQKGIQISQLKRWDREEIDSGNANNYWSNRLDQVLGQFRGLVEKAFAGDEASIGIILEWMDASEELSNETYRKMDEKYANPV